jgi:carboxyl-terminal processing protease
VSCRFPSRRQLPMLAFAAMKRPFLYGSLAVILALEVAAGWKVLSSSARAGTDDSGYANLTVFTRALQLIRQDYVDERKVAYKDLMYSAVRGMLNSLDPHSQFMEPSDFRDMQDDTKSEFGGLGLIVASRDGVITVVSPMEDTPGFRAGIMPNDQILRINGSTTERMTLQSALDLLRGEPGQKVSLTIFHPATKDTKEVTLQREIIKVASVKDAKILDPSLSGNFKIGYLRITQFNEPTSQELGQKLDALLAQGMQALVLDLRFNPGGLLNSAVDVCGFFVPPKTLVVYTEGREGSQRHEFSTDRNAKPRPNVPLALLVNNGTASAAEIVSGALKDLNRAILVGETTFGKGSVQSVIQLPDGSALRLTTARYFTPSRQIIHERGITPNIKASLTPEQEKALLLRRREGILTPEDQTLANDQRDPQLERAVDAIKGIMVYTQNERVPAAPKEPAPDPR